jgi:hypothetical protein
VKYYLDKLMPKFKRIFHPTKEAFEKPLFDSVTLFTPLGLLKSNSNIVNEIRCGFFITVIANLVKELELSKNKLLKFVNISALLFSRK